MSPATLAAPKKSTKPQLAMPGGFAGQLLRVDLTRRIENLELAVRQNTDDFRPMKARR